MTYAGLKSMIYAGLTDDDPRVKARPNWIQQHYTVEENPGIGKQGLFYYYHTFAKTLDVARKSTTSKTPTAASTTGARTWPSNCADSSSRTAVGSTPPTAGTRAIRTW